MGIRVAAHQPIFLPWSGLFYKALSVDCLVLLDMVQFPRGRGWMNRNRLKKRQGDLWLTVPVHRKGRGLQPISEVEICHESSWTRKHLSSLRHWYAAAPYLEDYYPVLEGIYASGHSSLAELNVELIRAFWDMLGLDTTLYLQSEVGVSGVGSKLLLDLCKELEAESYVTFSISAKFVDEAVLEAGGVSLQCVSFASPVYPQLWGDFRPNLSVLDLLLNCGGRALRVLSGSRPGSSNA